MKPTLLLVDDNEDLLDFLKDELSANYSILAFTSAKEAIHTLEAESVQLVISDVMMNEINGFELTRYIKTNFETCHIPVILLTAMNSLQAKIEGAENGADLYIEKPFTPQYLEIQIVNLLNNRNKLRDYFAKSPLVHLKSIAYSKTDEKFLDKLNEIINENINDNRLDVEKLAKILTMSRPTLYRKIKSLSNLTPNELINISRLKKAAELLAKKQLKIYEVSEMVGYSSQTNFGRNFLKQFGMTPTDYVASLNT